MNWLRTLRMMLKGAFSAPTAGEVSLAIAMGLAVGMTPKGNLLAFGLGVVMCSLRLNLSVALATAVFASLTAHYADPLFDVLGGALLETESLRPMWVGISERPYAAWLQFNNTVTLGAFVIAVAQIYPTYRLLLGPCERLLPKVIAKLKASRLMRLWSRMEWSGRISSALGS